MRSRLFLALVVIAGSLPLVLAQSEPAFEIPKKTGGIVIDGFLDEWTNVPGLSLEVGSPGVAVTGQPTASVLMKALWDEDSLYMALEWKDDVWDIQNVPRAQAVWVSPEHKRRDRNLFYDYFKFHIRESGYDYLAWIAPRIANLGPFSWQRLLHEERRTERATSPPAITGRDLNGVATLEIRLQWRELKTKAKPGKKMTASLEVADGDQPAMPLEVKVNDLKSLEWNGALVLAK
jgi:hypothetical protein